MSIHGGVRRRMTILDFDWSRDIKDDSRVLWDGWDLMITFMWFTITISQMSWARQTPIRARLRRFNAYKWSVMWFGYSIDFGQSCESLQKFVYGDASEWLLDK